MTSQSTSIEALLSRLTQESTSYYIEEKSISTRETIDGHTFYSRFKKYEGRVSQTLIAQHINKTITLAVPLDKNSLLFEYSGEHMVVFVNLLSHLAKEFGIDTLTITMYNFDKIMVYLPAFEYKSNIIEEFLEKVEKLLDLKLPEQWQILPRKNIPEIGNLLQLPREVIELDSF